MTSPHLKLLEQPASPGRQKSRSNPLALPPFGGRGRSRSSARRAHGWLSAPGQRADGFLSRWSRLMIASFASPEACALWADATTQTARNWMDGTHRPYGDVVVLAWRTLPAFDAIMRDGA